MELLLVLSLFTLILQLFGPHLFRWWQLPQPGIVGIDYLDDAVYEKNGLRCIATAYVAYLPVEYHQRATWPLVVFLHGSGSRGNDPKRISDDVPQEIFRSMENGPTGVVVAPQCLPHSSWNENDVKIFVECVSSRYRIDLNRIYLIGHSMGGYGTWATAASYPKLFAAIVPIAGGGYLDTAPALVKVPIWAFHGAKDKVIPVERSTKLVKALLAAGGSPKITVFPEAGHSIGSQVCSKPELWRWLFKQNLEYRLTQPSVEAAVKVKE